MNAKQLVEAYGEALIGRAVWTMPLGEYPGGAAIVTALNEDENAPEIVLNVIHPRFGPCGVFNFEEVELVVKAGEARQRGERCRRMIRRSRSATRSRA